MKCKSPKREAKIGTDSAKKRFDGNKLITQHCL